MLLKRILRGIIYLTGVIVVGWVILNVLVGLFATSIVFMPGIISLILAILLTTALIKAIFSKEKK